MTTDDDDVKINKKDKAANDNSDDASNRSNNQHGKNGDEKERVTIPLLEQAIMITSASVKHMMENLLN